MMIYCSCGEISVCSINPSVRYQSKDGEDISFPSETEKNTQDGSLHHNKEPLPGLYIWKADAGGRLVRKSTVINRKNMCLE